MGTVDGHSREPGGTAGRDSAEMKLVAIVLPVARAYRSRAFDARLGWRLDADRSSEKARMAGVPR